MSPGGTGAARPLADTRATGALETSSWDLIVIGGGITGAGILCEAARAGLRVLLVEQGDFASGTSSRSSKLVHGGLHYLARLDVALALEAIRERDRLLTSHADLVRRIDVAVPMLAGSSHSNPLLMGMLLTAYGLLAGGRAHRNEQLIPARARRRWSPPWPAGAPEADPAIRSVFQYSDGQTDDAGLVLRILGEGVEAGGVARNYTRVQRLMRDASGFVRGVRVCDVETGASAHVLGRVVVNAAGPWSDQIRGPLSGANRLRLVRGSHLVLPWRRLPLATAVAYLRPSDGGAVIMVPWKGVTLVGGTVVEHGACPGEAVISEGEVHTLLDDIRRVFPHAGIGPGDIQATFSACRPLVDATGVSAATASRRDAVWEEHGLITVAGGKLTTFRAMARRTLDLARPRLPDFAFVDAGNPRPAAGAAEVGEGPGLHQKARLHRLAAELAWCARHEGVRHLGDLLLRRTRIGFTAPQGGVDLLPPLAPMLMESLGWDQERWIRETSRYQEEWLRTMGPPGGWDRIAG